MPTDNTRAENPLHPESNASRPPDSTVLDRKMQKTRALVTSGCFLIGCLAYLTGAVQGHIAKVLPAIALMPVSSFLALKGMSRVAWSPAQTTASSLVLDVLVVSWVIFWTGGLSSPCLPFYLTPVMAASFRFGARGSVCFALLCLTGYLFAGTEAPGGSPVAEGAPGLILRIAMLFAASGFGIAALHRKLERYRREKILRRDLEKANQDLDLAYRELKSAQEQLLHTEKLASLGRLVAGVAHEINNPISFVYGNLIHLESYLDRLKALLAFDDGLPLEPWLGAQREAAKAGIDYDFLRQDLDQALSDCRNGTERVRRIVEALLRFSRMGKGVCREVRLSEPVENALCILRARLTQKITVVREVDSRATVAGDADELGQLFLNLLANAADAVAHGGTIRVRTVGRSGNDPPCDPVVIEIEDSGPGIPEEHRSRIFEPFFTTKEVGQGTGLGLSIAYGIARRHKGEITVHSPRHGGSLFRVRLPAWREAGSNLSEPAASGQQQNAASPSGQWCHGNDVGSP